MDNVDSRYEAIRQIGEECINDKELLGLIIHSKFDPVIVYDGFEPSGRLNIANCLMKVHNTNILTKNGCKVIFWIADLYAQLNQKFGGNLEKIQMVGRYMIEVWKAAGLNLENVEFIWASEEIGKRADEYWPLVMDISRRFNLSRILSEPPLSFDKNLSDSPISEVVNPNSV